MKNCTPLWREWRKSARRCGAKHISKSKRTKHTILRHFCKLRCWTSACRCGTKHISKLTCTKHTTFRPILEVKMFKKCAPVWREEHFEVKSAKNCGVRRTFGHSNVVLRGRRKGLCTLPRVSKTWGFVAVSTTTTTTLHYTTLHSTTTTTTTTNHYSTLHYTTLHYLHYTSLHYTTSTTAATLRYIALR